MERVGVDATGRGRRIVWSNGAIERVEQVETTNGPLVMSGLVDIQINGYDGISFNGDDVAAEELLRMARSIWATGVTTFYPTITTGSRERIAHSIRTVREAMRQDRLFAKSVGGIHVEGPYISPEDGPRGAHPLEHVRAPDWDEFSAWQDAAEGSIRIVTLSPEWEEAPAFIEEAANAGLVVAIGHTKATTEQIDAAVAAGARLSTHLGNGAHATMPRHPNYIWDQLANDALWASFIADGHHLPPNTLKAMVRAKTLDRSIFTSDAVWAAGMPPGTYDRGDGSGIDVLPNGRVQLAGTPYLAGAGLPLVRGVENGVRYAGLSLSESFRLATTNPTTLLGVDEVSALEPGTPANLVLADWDEATCTLTIRETILEGETVYRRA